jgi:hypothetical protein
VLAHFLDDNFTDSRNAADAGNIFVYAIVAQVIARIDIINKDARLVISEAASDLGRFDSVRNAIALSHVYSLLQDMPGDRSINRPRIDVGKAKPTSKLTRDATFPGGGRPINGNDAMGRLLSGLHDARQI